MFSNFVKSSVAIFITIGNVLVLGKYTLTYLRVNGIISSTHSQMSKKMNYMCKCVYVTIDV